MSTKYKLDPEFIYNTIVDSWKRWTRELHVTEDSISVVLGISGGKDSTVAAAVFAKILGPERVYGVMLPNGEQKDLADAQRVCTMLGIQAVTIDIENACNCIINGIKDNALNFSRTAEMNLPPRIRMSALYAVAQSIPGMAVVLNTCNLTESLLGYETLYGDRAGSFSPFGNLTVTEVIALGDWLGVEHSLVHKAPSDGLQGKTDEEVLGMKYNDVDMMIRLNQCEPELVVKVMARYRANKFKLMMINIPSPDFGFPNYVVDRSMSKDTSENA